MTPPIDKATLANVRKSLAILKQLEVQLQHAEKAMLDCSEDAARCQHLKGVAQAILDVYEPLLMQAQRPFE